MSSERAGSAARPWGPIPVDARRVLAAGVTPVTAARWAMEKRRDGKPDRALRLLQASATLIAQEAIDAGRNEWEKAVAVEMVLNANA